MALIGNAAALLNDLKRIQQEYQPRSVPATGFGATLINTFRRAGEEGRERFARYQTFLESCEYYVTRSADDITDFAIFIYEQFILSEMKLSPHTQSTLVSNVVGCLDTCLQAHPKYAVCNRHPIPITYGDRIGPPAFNTRTRRETAALLIPILKAEKLRPPKEVALFCNRSAHQLQDLGPRRSPPPTCTA